MGILGKKLLYHEILGVIQPQVGSGFLQLGEAMRNTPAVLVAQRPGAGDGTAVQPSSQSAPGLIHVPRGD